MGPGLLTFAEQMCSPGHKLVQIAESVCKQAQQVLLWLKDTALGSGPWAAAPERQAEPSAECQVSVPCHLQLQVGAVCLCLTACWAAFCVRQLQESLCWQHVLCTLSMNDVVMMACAGSDAHFAGRFCVQIRR